jgi:hypothetical protein
MHRAHDPRVETLVDGSIWVAKPFVASTPRRFFKPRSPWEPRLYGRPFGVSNAKLQNVYGELEVAKGPFKPIVLLCPAWLSGINM